MSMAIYCAFIIFLLCLPMHTCIARHLGVMDDEASNQKLHFSTKVPENKRDDSMVSSVQEEKNDIIFHATAIVLNSKSKDDHQSDRDSPLNENKVKRSETSPIPVLTNIKPLIAASHKNSDERNANFKLSTHMRLLRATPIEGSRGWRENVEQEQEQQHEHENENDFSYVKEAEEDASVMDYDAPHQKPPIHNRNIKN